MTIKEGEMCYIFLYIVLYLPVVLYCILLALAAFVVNFLDLSVLSPS